MALKQASVRRIPTTVGDLMEIRRTLQRLDQFLKTLCSEQVLHSDTQTVADVLVDHEARLVAGGL